MKIEKKHIIVGAIGAITITGALAYWQYTRLMNYCIGFNKLKANKLSKNVADIDVYLNFKNNSDLKLEILSQEYKVYINDKFVVKAENKNVQIIAPASMSVIGVKVRFNPEVAGANILGVALSLKPVIIRVEMKMKVKLWFFTVSIPYVYQTTLKELMAPSPTPNTNLKCK